MSLSLPALKTKWILGRKKIHRMIYSEKHELMNAEDRYIEVTFREYKPGDEKGMIDCIRDEYGDSYFKQDFYRSEYLKNEAHRHITFLVAETGEGEIAGMMILKRFYPDESMCEIASQIFKKKYRGYGMAMPFFRYGMKIMKTQDYSAAYCLPVLFHNVTQRLLYRLGLRATGLILNVFDMDKTHHSYSNGKNSKHSQGIQIMAMEKTDAGKLYLPDEHKEFCRTVYDSLGVTYKIDKVCGAAGHIKGMTVLEYQQNIPHSSLEIRIHRVGGDYKEQLEKLRLKYPPVGKQTVNVFLNINDRNAVEVYKYLSGQGYFFTGLKPLCSDREYMILHNSGDVKICFEDYVFSEEFEKIKNYIEKGEIDYGNHSKG